jgi:hypothetical protein
MDFLKKAAVSSAGKTGILKDIITVLVDNKQLPEAVEVLKRFPSNAGKDPNYLVANFLVNNLTEADKVKLIPELRSLVKDGIKEPLIWYWLIFYLVEFEKDDEAENYCQEAIKLWPAKAEYFKSAMVIEEES